MVAWLSQRQADAASGQQPPPTIGQVLGHEVAAKCLPEHGDQVRMAEDLIDEIRRRVGDPNLRTAPIHRVAWAVAEGRIPRPELYQLLDDIDRRRSTGRASGTLDGDLEPIKSPGAYFVRSAQGICQRFGVAWPERKAK